MFEKWAVIVAKEVIIQTTEKEQTLYTDLYFLLCMYRFKH